MCVILYGRADRIRPELGEAHAANPHGIGLAWRDAVGRRPMARWIKGLDLAQADAALEALGVRAVAVHCRIATTGGIHPALTHPFPVERHPSCALHGITDYGLLFHNGHVFNWEPLRGPAPDAAPWSDSRAIAHALASGAVSSIADPRFSYQRIFLFMAKGTHFYHDPRSWTTLRSGVMASNTCYKWESMIRDHRDHHPAAVRDVDDWTRPLWTDDDYSTRYPLRLTPPS